MPNKCPASVVTYPNNFVLQIQIQLQLQGKQFFLFVAVIFVFRKSEICFCQG